MALVELKEVDKIYSDAASTQVLFAVNLSFENGSCSAIVGESGSGKSTLLNIMGTLDRPTQGEVVIDGKLVNVMDNNRLAELRNETIGFVFQFHYLLPEFTVMENVLMPYFIRKRRPSKETLFRMEGLLEMLGILRLKNSLVTRISGGEQQRTAIARALINSPKMLLADEPTGNLDSETTEKICKAFRQINLNYGTTFIVVTHDRRVAEHTDRIIEMRDGKIVADVKK
jgi:lipoprotein-releasing system ATP-binding protein